VPPLQPGQLAGVSLSRRMLKNGDRSTNRATSSMTRPRATVLISDQRCVDPSREAGRG
jgi:hypothetical protein